MISDKFKMCFLICLISIGTCLNSYSQDEEFKIKHADFLEAGKENIYIKGKVLINYKDATIEAPECIVESNEKGEPEKAIFTGMATLKLKDRMLEADKITISIKDELILAEGNTLSKLKDKKNELITISSDYQELHWNGESANASGNLKTTYQDTQVTSEEASIIYKDKKPSKAIFHGTNKQASLEQPTNITIANELIFDIQTKDVQGAGNVQSTIWPDKKAERDKQDPIHLSTDSFFLDEKSGIISAKSEDKKVRLDYQLTNGESKETYLIRDSKTGKPEKIIFKGNANVKQEDKQISSEEVVFNFSDKKLTSNTKTNIRPKTIIFKKGSK